MAIPPELDPKALEDMTRAMRALGKEAAEIAAIIEGMTAEQIKFANASAEAGKGLANEADLLEKMSDYARQHNQYAQNRSALAQNRIREEERLLEIQYKSGEIGKEKYLQDKMNLKTRMDDNNAADRSAQLAQETALAITGVSDAWKDTLIGSFFQGDFQGNLVRTVEALQDQFNIANMLGSSLMKVQEATMMMVWSADSQFASVNQLTNGTGEYNDMILTTMENNTQFNVDLETAGEAVGELYQNMSQFTEMTDESQAALVEATAQLDGLGIGAALTTQNMEILNKSLGMSAEQAIAVQKDFAAMAADLGVNAAQIAGDFEANSDVFVAYGEQAIDVFKEMAAAAKATGVEMQALLAITTQFDTFEGAATAAGKLNAILGGGVLNSMELLNASEEERVRLLIQSIQLSGKSWESMNKFEKIAVANAAGITDMTEASKLFGQSLSEYDAAQKKVEDNAEAQKQLEERAKAATAAQDKFKRIMEQFAIAVQPVLNAIHWLVDGVLKLNDMTGGLLIPTMIALLGVMAIARYRLQIMAFWQGILAAKTALVTLWKTASISAFFGAAAAETTEAGAAGGAAVATTGLAVAMVELSVAMLPLIPMITAIAMAIFGLAIAIAAPFIAIAVLVWSLKELVIAMMEMTDAIAPALLGLIAFGAASMVALPMIGIGIAMMVSVLIPVIPFMVPVAIGLMHLAVAALVFGAAAWLLGQGFKALSDGIKGFPVGEMLGLALALIPFGIALIFAAYPFVVGGLLIGIAAVVLGFGLQALAAGIEGFTGRGMLETMMQLGLVLILFGLSLIMAAVPFTIGALLIGVPAVILGFGLQSLAAGIEGFTKRGMFEAMMHLTYMLVIFGIGLIAAAAPFTVGAILIGIGALVLGYGLQVLAKGLKPFARGTLYEVLFILPLALTFFGLALIPAGAALMYGGIMLLIGALFTAPALLLLYLGVKPWMGMDFEKVAQLGITLNRMTDGLFFAAFWLMLAGPMLFFGALYAAPALLLLAIGLLPWMAIDLELVGGIGWALAKLAAGLAVAGAIFWFAGPLLLLGAFTAALAMAILAGPLMAFSQALAVMAPFAGKMIPMAEGLIALGRALPALGWGLFKLGFWASAPWFDKGLETLTTSLHAFAGAMQRISAEKAVALGIIFQGLAGFTDLDEVSDTLWDLAWGIWALGRALDSIPETKALAFNVTADSLANLINASVQLTPEVVENVEGMASAAREYANAQSAMKSPDKDAFVQALREVMGENRSASAKQGGQDIVLEVDGDEFARAVNAAIDSKHGVRGF